MRSELLSAAKLQEFIDTREQNVLLFSQRVPMTRWDPVYSTIQELDHAASEAVARGKRNFFCTCGSDFSSLAASYFEGRGNRREDIRFYFLDFAKASERREEQEASITGVDGRFYFFRHPAVRLEGEYYKRLLEISSELFAHVPTGALERMQLYRLAEEMGVPIVNILERAREASRKE